jgi:hypothetical protein
MSPPIKRCLLLGGLVCSLLTLAWLGLAPGSQQETPVMSGPANVAMAASSPAVSEKPISAAPSPSALSRPDSSDVTESSTSDFARLSDPDRIRALAREDPAEAILSLASTPPGEKRDAMLEIVCAEIAQFDPAEAVALVNRFSGQNPLLLENLVHQWAAQNGTAAEANATALPAGELRNRLLSRVAVARAKNRPAEAATLVLAQIEPGEIQHEALIAVLHEWASQDFAPASAWVSRFPAGPLRDRAIDELAGIRASR